MFWMQKHDMDVVQNHRAKAASQATIVGLKKSTAWLQPGMTARSGIWWSWTNAAHGGARR